MFDWCLKLCLQDFDIDEEKYLTLTAYQLQEITNDICVINPNLCKSRMILLKMKKKIKKVTFQL